MEAVKFHTRISDKGVFSLPKRFVSSLCNTDVEVMLVPVAKKTGSLKQWAGAFKVSSNDYDNAIYESLKEKHL
ncbi:MAG: hypothetical protein LBN95_05810 [Prevotellaceae bacterium]|jgi:hypothetical protein|nr:hypothetical protein [Prevotellaceae bacterium]